VSVLILCVGKMKEKPYRQMADEYLKRLGRYGKYEEAEIPDLPEPASGLSEALEEQLKMKEGEAILAKIRPGDRVIAMTIGGKRRSSEELAEHLGAMKASGAGRLVFVIGGSLGLGRNVLKRANEELSMGAMTFPHQLARVMLLEQLYRQEKINAGERYHK
jgi:23S rRNA (pseudouridine1915-N3)-methyltransferase